MNVAVIGTIFLITYWKILWFSNVDSRGLSLGSSGKHLDMITPSKSGNSVAVESYKVKHYIWNTFSLKLKLKICMTSGNHLVEDTGGQRQWWNINLPLLTYNSHTILEN